jgi:hypothetical protein
MSVHMFRTDLDGTVTLTTAGDGSYTLETSRSEKAVLKGTRRFEGYFACRLIVVT